MENSKFNFPSIQKSVEDFIYDEDGNITRNKLVSIGTMIMVMAIVSAMNADAVHSSHRSHSSHVSHSSTSYIRSHSNHVSHSDHGSHASHASHTSHSNTSSHSNSLYSSEGDVSYGPGIASIPKVKVAIDSTKGYQTDLNTAINSAVDMTVHANPNWSVPSKTPDLPDTTFLQVPSTPSPQTMNTPEIAASVVVDPGRNYLDDLEKQVLEPFQGDD